VWAGYCSVPTLALLGGHAFLLSHGDGQRGCSCLPVPCSLLPAFWNRAAAAARRCNRPWVAASACVSLRGKKVLTAGGRRVLEGVPGRPIHFLSWAGGCERR